MTKSGFVFILIMTFWDIYVNILQVGWVFDLQFIFMERIWKVTRWKNITHLCNIWMFFGFRVWKYVSVVLSAFLLPPCAPNKTAATFLSHFLGPWGGHSERDGHASASEKRTRLELISAWAGWSWLNVPALTPAFGGQRWLAKRKVG